MEDKIVLPAGISMGGADENWSDISMHQSAMQGHPTAYLLKSRLSCTNRACMHNILLWQICSLFFRKMDNKNEGSLKSPVMRSSNRVHQAFSIQLIKDQGDFY